jgi:hypothetical protein
VTAYFPSGVGKRSAIAAVACLTIGGFVAMSTPETANKGPAISVSVNRAKKTDQLPKAISNIDLSKSDLRSRSSVTTPRAATKRSALGCERVFSAIVDPAHSQLYRSCIV